MSLALRILQIALALDVASAVPLQAQVSSGAPLLEPQPPADRADPQAIAASPVDVAELERKRAEAEKDLVAANQPGGLKRTLPPSIPAEDVQERRTLLQQIVRGYDQQIDDHRRLDEARRRHAEALRANQEWTGFTDPPPYSILVVDQLWEAMFSLTRTVEGIQSQLAMIGLRSERARERFTTSDERLRQASERAESARDPAEAARLAWARDMEALRQRTAAVELATTETSRQRIEEELAEARARFTLAQRQFHAAEHKVQFTHEDLETIRQRLDTERRDFEAEVERMIAEERLRSRALEEAEGRLKGRLARRGGSERPGPVGSGTAKLAMTVELRRVEHENVTVRIDLFKQILDLIEGEHQLWGSRFAVYRADEPGTAREAYAHYKPFITNFQAWHDRLRQQIDVVSGQIGEQENRVNNASASAPIAVLSAILDAYGDRQQVYNRVLQRAAKAGRLVERWQSESKGRTPLPLSARVDDWIARASAIVKRIWHVELFAAEDTIEVDGKPITGRRSITVGKVVGALIILLIGYWLCALLARFVERMAVKRLRTAPEVAALIRRWTLAFLVLMLVIVSLMSVKIPLTIFAFLGGAIAIGVGFGAQTLLKNVISGMLLLIERPLRVGDIVELDNIRGRVTTIGLRSSTIRDTKGVETLIPNSHFLERHLTNWTYSSHITRHSLRIGVPYGSEAQGVSELLAAVAKEHKQVLSVPSPQVLLEDFGDKALIFVLHYWLEIRLDVDANEVASALRFAIDKRFGEAGVRVLPAA